MIAIEIQMIGRREIRRTARELKNLGNCVCGGGGGSRFEGEIGGRGSGGGEGGNRQFEGVGLRGRWGWHRGLGV